MTDLTPAEHRQVLAAAWLMYARFAAGWQGYNPLPSARLESERPKPPEPGPHAHRRNYRHYNPATRKPKGHNGDA